MDDMKEKHPPKHLNKNVNIHKANQNMATKLSQIQQQKIKREQAFAVQAELEAQEQAQRLVAENTLKETLKPSATPALKPSATSATKSTVSPTRQSVSVSSKTATPGIKKLFLIPGREKSVLRQHPWIFSGGVDRVEGDPIMGEDVLVCSHTGEPLAIGAYSPLSQIRAKIWSFNPNAKIDQAFFDQRVQSAFQSRKWLYASHQTNGYRLIFSEGDGLPGVVVDRYGPYLMVQLLSAGAEFHKQEIVQALSQIEGIKGIWERSDAGVRKLEGLEGSHGKLWGEDVPEKLIYQEQDRYYQVDLKEGHKTGFYLDQKINRQKVQILSKDKDVLNVFAYTGGFGIAAIRGGAKSVINIESASVPVQLGQENAKLTENQIQSSQSFEYRECNAFEELRNLKKEGKTFDLIILDPPKLCEKLDQKEKATRAYKDANLHALQLLRENGTLFTFSCSGLIDSTLFSQIISMASLDAKVDIQVIDMLHQAPDHPWKPTFPEGYYLKGLVVRRCS
jgi:23S rRNA (cytosine1962-C5)-methyltransferase